LTSQAKHTEELGRQVALKVEQRLKNFNGALDRRLRQSKPSENATVSSSRDYAGA
jgi:hypothetical protein